MKEWCKHQAKLRTPFHVIAIENTTSVYMSKWHDTSWPIDLSCSLDNVTYEKWELTDTPIKLNGNEVTYTKPYVINANQSLYIKGNNDALHKFMQEGYSLRCSNDFRLAGNIMSLLKSVDFHKMFIIDIPWCFSDLLQTSKVIDVDELLMPATDIAAAAYAAMFYGTRIHRPPKLPATKIGNAAYNGMFYNCRQLSVAAEFPEDAMFVHKEGAKQYGEYGSQFVAMYRECTSLSSAPRLPFKTLSYGCYAQMFFGCTALTSVPDIPATTLAEDAFYQTFQNCKQLTSVNMTGIEKDKYDPDVNGSFATDHEVIVNFS